MTSHPLLARLSCMAACACAALSSQAAITVYEDQAAFLQAAINPSVDSFDSLNDAALDGPLDRFAGSYGYTAAVEGGFFSIGTPADYWLSPNQAVPITFSGFTVDVNAVGGFFFATDVDGTPLSGESIILTATDITGSVVRTMYSLNATTFLGFVSDGSMLELRVAVSDTGFNNAWATVNDLTLAQSVAAVPEPAAPALLLAGLAAVAVAARRKRRG